MRTRRSLPSSGIVRLGAAALVLVCAVSATVACSRTVRGRASIAQGDINLAQDPAITNIGVDKPIFRPNSSASSSSHSRGPGSSASTATMTLGDYLDTNQIDLSPVGPGEGLTVTAAAPRGWIAAKPENPGQQVALDLSNGKGADVYAMMRVMVVRLSKSAPVDELVAAAKNSLDRSGTVQAPNNGGYQGYPSTAAIVEVTQKDSRLVHVARYIFVQDSDSTYLVSSLIVCGAVNWSKLRTDLLGLDSSIEIAS